MLQWSLIGADGLVGHLGKRGPLLMQALVNKVNALDIMLQSKIQGRLHNDLLRSHTQHLIGSIRVVPATIEAGTIVGKVLGGGGLAPYGKFLEYGTAPHEIVAKNKKALAFMADGKQVIVKSVHHPGTLPYLFMRGTLTGMSRTIIRELQKTADEVMRQP